MSDSKAITQRIFTEESERDRLRLPQQHEEHQGGPHAHRIAVRYEQHRRQNQLIPASQLRRDADAGLRTRELERGT